jgi:hypothetical protein
MLVPLEVLVMVQIVIPVWQIIYHTIEMTILIYFWVVSLPDGLDQLTALHLPLKVPIHVVVRVKYGAWYTELECM